MKYTKAEMELVEFEIDDIVTASGDIDDPGESGEDEF